jgi:hypothetical protein
MEICEKGNKFSARSDEMEIRTFPREVHFEPNCARKGVFFPPKAGLPPLIGGSPITLFLYEFLKNVLILN